jgi:hypothetical protein
MSTRSAVIQVEPDLAEAFNAAPEPEQERVKTAMRSLLRLVPPAPEKAKRLSKKETGLFLKINRTLPEEKQRRYEELKEKMSEETLTKKEHAELLELIEDLQQIWVERWQAVIDLAKLRKIPPQEMMRQLGVDPKKYG